MYCSLCDGVGSGAEMLCALGAFLDLDQRKEGDVASDLGPIFCLGPIFRRHRSGIETTAIMRGRFAGNFCFGL